MAKVIGIIGSRRRNTSKDFKLIRLEFKKQYQKGDAICSGGCRRGADRFAEVLMDNYRIPEEKRFIFPARWKKYGNAAGPIRNTKIAKQSDILIACVAEDRTGGTEDTIKKFERMKGVKAIII